jgi:DNA polymerase-3 subunit gamma/tau
VALALYRKYRPRTFAEVIGQEHVTEPLMQALRSGRLNHAYLFSGPRGCGKTSSARILARSLNCAKGPTPEPCGECDSCVALAPDGSGSIDVIEIDAASHGGVDDARDLRERAIFAPVASRFKVYVIDEAHMVSSAGFNALLKLVEEPPEYVKFVFATTEPEKVLGTIKSRTHHYPFRLIPPGVLRPYLEQLCQGEGVAVEPAVFPLVVRAGGGSARDSLSVLDQLIAGAGAEGVTYARAVALLGVTDVALIDEMCDALAAEDGATAFSTIDRVADAGHDPRRFATDLLARLRDLIVLQQIPDAGDKGLLDAPDDELARMAAQAQRFGPATLSRMADIVHNGLTEMRGTTAPRLLLELICARMLLPAADGSTAALLHRLERMERRLTLAPGSVADAETAERPGATNSAPAASSSSAGRTGGRSAESASEPATGRSAGTATGNASTTGGTAAGSGATAAGSTVATDAASYPEAGPGVRPAEGSTIAGHALTPDGAERPHGYAAGESRTGSQSIGSGVGSPAGVEGRAAERYPGGRAGEQPTGGPVPAAEGVGAQGAAAGPGSTVGQPGALDAAAVRRVWDEILGYVGRKRRAAAAVAREATVREVDGDTLVLVFKHGVHANMLTNSPDLLLEAVYEVLGAPAPGAGWKIRCEVGGAGSGPTGGGSAPLAPVPPTPRVPGGAPAPAPVADSGWPVTAQPGGSAPTPRIDSQPPVPPVPAGGAPGSAGGTDRATGPDRGAGPGRSAARAAAQSAAVKVRPGGKGTGSGPAVRAGGSGRSSDSGQMVDSGPPGEPPYDPDYDPPVRDSAGYEGFDPGDEPLDDVIDAQTARQSSEQQALHLLAQTLGAEKIGELDAR